MVVAPLLVVQEDVKGKHPQLQYEYKVYRLLAGGGTWLRHDIGGGARSRRDWVAESAYAPCE